uniref:Uncharacterized protein n=1 Tax=Rangifer tarandus platyrhynchus TaxID=3082113 RepID=A0ACB0F805_RANTA|nr:unnamed protein product [Rangifer tarandus platyrhynchus]
MPLQLYWNFEGLEPGAVAEPELQPLSSPDTGSAVRGGVPGKAELVPAPPPGTLLRVVLGTPRAAAAGTPPLLRRSLPPSHLEPWGRPDSPWGQGR